MNFYPFHIGDYHAHTAHLDLLEDLAYRRMLDYCFLHESGLPESVEEISRVIRMRTHCDCIANALLEFFSQHSDGTWHNDRADSEIARFREKSGKAAKSARKRWENGDANAMRTQCERNANQNQEPEPRTRTKDIRAAKAATVTKKTLVDDFGIPDQVAADYLAIRKAKRLPLTQTAWERLQADFAVAGMSVCQGVTFCATEGWAGFKVAWLKRVADDGKTYAEKLRDEYMDGSWADKLTLGGGNGQEVE